MRRILTIDVGGVRGISPAVLLSTSSETGRPLPPSSRGNRDICHLPALDARRLM